MSNISKKIPNHINRLVLLLSDDINNNNFDNKNLINEFILAIGNLSIKSILSENSFPLFIIGFSNIFSII